MSDGDDDDADDDEERIGDVRRGEVSEGGD